MPSCHVTGANGFLGSNVVRALLAAGYEVVALCGSDLDRENLAGLDVEVREIDLLDPESLHRALRGGERLIHTAADYSFWQREPDRAYRVNALGTRNVLTAARDLGFARVVHTSTTAALTPGFQVDAKQGDEDNLVDLSRFGGSYKSSKIMAEIAALRLAAEGLPLVIVYPTIILGAGDRRPTPTGSMIVHYLQRHMKVFVEMPQNLVHVEDAARGHLLALERGRAGRRYVLGGDDLSMREVVDLLADVTGIPAPRFAIPHPLLLALGRVNDWLSSRITKRPPLFPLEAALHARDSRPFSNARAALELGFSPRPARAVLEDAVRWFVDQGHGSESDRARIQQRLEARRGPTDDSPGH